MEQLPMELRDVDTTERLVVGVVAPYDETTFLTPDPAGERILRGAFTRSVRHRGDKVPFLRTHDHSRVMGRSRRFEDTDGGLVGTFAVNAGDDGDVFLEDLRNGYYAGLSIGFTSLVADRGAGGVREIREGKLVEVSAVGVPAYEGAALLAVRSAQDLSALLAPFANRPDVNLAPIPPIVHTRR